MVKRFFNFTLGLLILFGFYILAVLVIKLVGIKLPPAILGLILFAISLSNGIIKEAWIKTTSEFFIKNIALLFVPFIVGLIVYQNILFKNWLAIAFIVLTTTTLTIILTGLFVEYGIKYLRAHRIRRKNG